MKYFFVFLCFLTIGILLGAEAQGGGGCNQNGAVNDTYFNYLVSELEAQPNELIRKDILIQSVEGLTNGFSGPQVVILLSSFDNELIIEDILEAIAPWILGITCDDVNKILQSFNNELLRLDVLPYLVNLTTDLRQNNGSILQNFVNTFNRRDAAEIIEKATPLSCVWGDTSVIKRLVFIVDVSGSMSTTFLDTNSGNTYTRLQYVALELSQVIQNSLQPYQEFNIVAFSDSATAWQRGVVPVNNANIQSALQFVNSLAPGGGTYMLNALNYAFNDPNCDGVFLLSDGEPTDSSSAILAAAATWSGSGNPIRPVNTIAFQAGGTYDPTATQFMYELASTTTGVFRSIN